MVPLPKGWCLRENIPSRAAYRGRLPAGKRRQSWYWRSGRTWKSRVRWDVSSEDVGHHKHAISMDANAPKAAKAPDQRRRWESIVEQQIAEAREQGAFDNLRGEGQPLRLE